MSHLAKAREVFDIELAALKAVRALLDQSFDLATATVVEALKLRRKIVIVGIGKSGNVGQKIAATLTSTGSTAVILNSVDALHGDVGIVNDGDVILALSYSGESDELLNLLPADQFDVTAETSSSYHQAWCAVETGMPNISRVRQRSANSKAASWASSY